MYFFVSTPPKTLVIVRPAFSAMSSKSAKRGNCSAEDANGRSNAVDARAAIRIGRRERGILEARKRITPAPYYKPPGALRTGAEWASRRSSMNQKIRLRCSFAYQQNLMLFS